MLHSTCAQVRAHSLSLPMCPAAPQAEKLDEMLAKRGQAIDKVLEFKVPDSLLVGGPHALQGLRCT